jgi:hypothetical protein
LVDATRVEEENAINDFRLGSMGVAVDDDVGLRKPAAQASRQAAMRAKVAKAHRP